MWNLFGSKKPQIKVEQLWGQCLLYFSPHVPLPITDFLVSLSQSTLSRSVATEANSLSAVTEFASLRAVEELSYKSQIMDQKG